MSNATQPSHSSGDSRRRRSRGGKNRNNNQENRRGGDRENRGERGERGDRGPRDHNRNSNSGSNSNRAEEFRPQAPRRTYAPPKLTFWQKLLNMVGLYKAPTPPARGSIKPEAAKPREESAPRPAKSNTRNARTTDGPAAEKTERSGERPPKRERGERSERGERTERGERGERSERGSRQGDRPRGGDGSTVESPRVYVGNLSYDVTEQDLQELFKGIGSVRNVEIVYNRSTHRSKGYGFVEMLRMDEAVRSVEVLHDQPFMGRKLIVSGAKSKGQDEREDKEERPEREPRPIVVAPMPAAATAAVATAAAATAAVVDAPAATEVQAEAEEPVIQTIIENVTPAEAAAEAAETVEAAAPSADDLVSKYGFDEPAEKSEQP